MPTTTTGFEDDEKTLPPLPREEAGWGDARVSLIKRYVGYVEAFGGEIRIVATLRGRSFAFRSRKVLSLINRGLLNALGGRIRPSRPADRPTRWAAAPRGDSAKGGSWASSGRLRPGGARDSSIGCGSIPCARS
jgi:hypothetical protein